MTGDANRIMVLERVIPAPVALVWAAWSDPDALPRWWGPDGHSCRTKQIDLREGGEWVFDMIGPDGTIYPNRHRYRVYKPMERIEYTLDDPGIARPHAEATITFAAEGQTTRLTLQMIFATAAEHDTAVNFGAVALGYQTLDKLAAFIAAR